MVVVASGLLLLVLDYNSVHGKWKKKLIFALKDFFQATAQVS